MRRSLFLNVIGIILTLFAVTSLNAQPSRQGLPASMELNLPNVSNSVVVDASHIDWSVINAEDQLRLSQNLPVRAGFSLPVNKSMEQDGEWELLPDGRMMWRLKIETQSAVSLGVVFDMFHLPEGAELYLYNADRSFVIGAFTSENNNPANTFSTHLIPGSTVILEYIETPNNGLYKGNLNPISLDKKKVESYRTSPAGETEYTPQGVLRISEIIYSYNDDINDATKDLGDGGTCMVNINCVPEGDYWQDEKRGVARILFREGAGWYYCSGSLVNNTLENGTPYFLTAFHCGAVASAADHNVWQFYFNYERAGCPNLGTPPNNMITGCIKRAEGDISGGTDMQLVELNSTPSLAWNPYYNGWDRSGATTTGGVSIHHPAGDAKKISTFTGTTTSATWFDGTNTGATNGHWTFPLWAATTNGQGVSEGGSSGSSLFNNAGRVIGTLSGGSSQCGGPYSGDLYGKFSIHWQNAVNGTGNAYELKYWLDPAGTNPTTLDGMDPNAIASPPVTNFSATPTTINAGQTIQFTDLTTNLPQSWSWTFPSGYPSTSTERNPTVTWVNPGTYTITLTTSNAYGSDTETKTAYITVNPYSITSPVTIGTGTGLGGYFPYGVKTNATALFTFVRDASIYTTAEVGAAATITALAWRPGDARTDTRNIQIYLKHTNETAFTTAVTDDAIISGATLVYNGTFTPNVAGWHTIPLQTSFSYNGSSNLMVIVFVNSTVTPGDVPSNCYFTTTAATTHQQWSGKTDPTGTGTLNTNRPNIQISKTGITAPIANFGVEPNILYEGFEDGVLPTGWSTIDNDGDGNSWDFVADGSLTTHGGVGAASSASWINVPLTPDNWLITPAVDLSNAAASYQLKYYVIGQDPAWEQETYGIYVSTTGTAVGNFTSLLQEQLPASHTAYQERTIDLSAYAGNPNVYIAFRHWNCTDWFRLNLDDVSISTSVQPANVTIYEGDNVRFMDLSTNNPSVWAWSLPGGTPTSTNEQSPIIPYHTHGVYDVTLTAGNAAGSDAETKTGYVTVLGRAPMANFYGTGNLKDINYRPFIPIGGSVEFTDYSWRYPEGWAWSFPGGTPSTSTSQNPPTITYTAPGFYSPSLTVTNTHGSDIITGTNFVVVGGKDTCSNLLYEDGLSVYSYDNGLIPGHAMDTVNSVLFYIWNYAEKYENSFPGKITGLELYVYLDSAIASKTVTFNVWDGSTGSPGTILGTKTVSLPTFTNGWTFLAFDDSIAVSGDFFIGYRLNYDGTTHNYDTHQFCGAMTSFRDPGNNSTAYLSTGNTYPGTWYSFEDWFGSAASLTLHPEFTYDFAGTIVSASATPGCGTGSVTLTASVSANQTFYLQTGAGAAVANWTGNTNTHTFTGLANGDYKGYVVEGANTSPTSNTVTLTNLVSVPVSVAIVASPTGAICSGTSVTFTATPTNGGATPAYQWYEGGSAVGTGLNTYTTTTLTNLEAVYVVLTSNQTCVTGNPATSNTINTTVNPNLPVSVSIAASPAGAICAGTSVTFTATPVNGGTTPAYQWYEGGAPVGTGTGTYTTTGLTTGEAVYCVLTSNAVCPTTNPATSNTITTTVNPNLPVSVTIAANPGTTICSGTSVTFTATPVNGGTTPVYQWKVNGVVVGSNSPTYTSNTLAMGNTVTCTVTSNATCPTGNPAVSNTLTMTVNTTVAASVSIAASPTGAICAGTSVTFTATPTNGGAAPTYQWYEGGAPVGTGLSTYATTGLTTGEAVYCVMTSNAVCVTGSPATSNTINTTVNTNNPVSVTIAANPGTTICTGTSVTFTATPTNGGTTPVYQWKLNGGNVGSNSTTYTNAALVAGDIVTCQLTSNATCATGSPATSNALTMTVNSSLPVSVSIAASPGNNICAGTNVTFTATPTNGGTTPAYQWKVNGTNVGTGATYSSTTLTTGQIVTCVLTSSEGCATGSPATSNAITMTVTANVTPSVSIAASSTTICSGTSVTFTATPTNGGATPVYQWKLNGANVGSNSTTYTNAALATGDIVTCSMTSALTCTVENPVTSNSIVMTVNPNKPVSVSISASATTICTGTTVNFTATPTNGGTTPAYQWYVGATPVGTGSTYSSSTLADGNIVTCVLTSNETCATGSPATSNAIAMTVNSSLPVSVSIAANPGNVICAGTSVTFTATPTNGGTTPTYTWKVNGVTQGANSPTFTTSSLTNTQSVTCILASSEGCATGSPATSNAIAMTVNPTVAASVTIAASPSGAICAGTSVTFTATPTNGGTPTYQWYEGGSAVGTGLSTYATTGLTTGEAVYCVMTSNATCVTGSPATSNTINTTVNANNPVSVTVAATATTICTGTSVTFTATPVNGGAAPVYAWYLNSAPVGSNSSTYTNAALATGDAVYCVVTSNATCATGSPATSNTVTMTVNSSLPASVVISANPGSTICAGTSVTFTAVPTNGGATPSYQWKVNATNVGANSPTYTSNTLTTGQSVTCVMTSSEGCATGSPATSNAIAMTVNPNVAASVSISSSAATICDGTSVTFTATPTNGGTPTYQWYEGGSAVGTGLSTYATTGLTTGEAVYCVMTSNATCVTGSPATSNTINTTVNANNPVSVTVAATATTICTGTSVTFTATPVNGGAAPVYTWYLNSAPVGSNSSTYTNATLATGDAVYCVVTSNATCATGSPATSNTVTMTVNSSLPASVVISANPGSTICAGTSVTFTAVPTNGGVTPTYQWKVNATNVGANSPTYTSNTLATGQSVTCVMTSSEGCATGSPATSNAVVMTVNPTVAASVSISSSAATICDGTSVTFTATPTNGGTPTYQWYEGGSAVGTGLSTYTTTGLTTGEAVYCVMTSNATCVTGSPATSNTINTTVNANNPVSVTAAATATTICTGTSVTFTATPVNGGAAPVYAWYLNSAPVGSNSSTYTNAALATGDAVYCVVTSNVTCATGSPATSNTVTMTVNANLPVSVSIAAAPATTVCAGTAVTFTATPVNGGTTPTYAWYLNSGFTGTGATYMNVAPAAGDQIYCVVTSDAACVSGNPATSNTVALTVNAAPAITAQPLATIIGDGGNTSFSVTATGAGLTYQWQVSSDGGTVYNNILAAGTNPVYSDWTTATLVLNGVVTANDGLLYRCVVTGTCAPSVTSTGALLTVNNAPAITSHPANATICAGLNTTFSVSATGTITGYQWQLSTDGGTTFNNITTAGTNPVYAGYTTQTLTLTGVVIANDGYQYRCVVIGAVPPDATSNAAILTIEEAPVVTVNPTPVTICNGANTGFTVTATGDITAYQWQVSTDGGSTYNNIIAAGTNPTYAGWNTTALSLTGAVTANNGQLYRCVVTGPCAPAATSSGALLNVNPSMPVSVNIAAAPAGSICSGTPVVFTATPTNGGTPAYQWYLNGSAVGINSNTYSNNALANGDDVSCMLTSNVACATGNPATSNIIDAVVNPNMPVSVSISAFPAGPVCDGTSVSFTAVAVNGGSAPAYAWFVNGSVVASGSSMFTTSILNNGDLVTCSVVSDIVCATGNPATSAPIAMVVNPQVPVSVSIVASPAGAICDGTSVSFTATPVNGGTTPVYEWFVNGVAIGLNSNTFTTSSLTNGDAVTCHLTSDVACGTGNPATSNAVNMIVNPDLPVSISISASATTICSGASVTFTASATNGGMSPVYAWFVNGNPVGSNSPVFTSSALVNNDNVTCVLTSNATCATGNPATSNAVSMVVNPSLPVSISIAPSPAGTICEGTSVTFTATPVNGGATPVYAWFVNGSAVGSNSPTYTSNTLLDNQTVVCVVNSNATCAINNPAPSNTLIMDVAPLQPVSVSIAASPAGSICEGTSVTFTATAVNGGTTPVYSWFVNGVSVGLNSSTFASSTLNNADAVTCELTSNVGCASGSPATSNTVAMTVTNNLPVSVSIAASATNICAGNAVTFTATPTNGGTTPDYAWFVNGTSVGFNSATFVSSTLLNGDVVTCSMTSDAVCVTGSPATSNPVAIIVNPSLPVSVAIAAAPAGTVCEGTSVTFTATPVNGGLTPVYAWFVNGSAVGSNSPTYTSNTLLDNQTVVCVVNSNATCAINNPAPSNTLIMDVAPLQPVSVSIAASPAGSVCEGTPVTFTATPINGGTTPVYAWFVNGVSVGSNSSTFSSSTLNNADAVTCELTSNIGCASGSPATSNAVAMTVTNNLPVSVSIAASATTICAGTPVTFTATPTNGGTTPDYAWFVNGTAAGANSATFTSNTLINGDQVTCSLTSSVTCVSGNPAVSGAVTMVVNPSLPVSATVSASPAGTICAGTPVTFTASPVNGGSTPVYQWYVNGAPVGLNSSAYTSNVLQDNQTVNVVVTSNALCATGNPAVSTPVIMDVNPLMPASVAIVASPAGAICDGTSVTFTATPVNGGTTPVYSWFVNGVSVGSNNPVFTSSILTNNDVVTCVMTSNESCVSGSPATSNALTMTVNTNMPVSVSITGVPPGAICAGTSVTFVATPVNGGNNPVYNWYVNGIATGSNSSTFTSVALANNDAVSCVLTSNATCTTNNPATSNVVTMAVNPVLTPAVTIAASASVVCAGTSVTFTATATDAGVAPVYAWYINGTLIGPNSATYTSSSLINGDVVTCTVISNATCSVGATATSNAVTMTVNPVLAASVIIAAIPGETICEGTNVTFVASPVNGGSSPVYNWYANGVPVASGAIYASSTLTDGNVITCVMNSNETCVSGNPATSNAVTMNVGTVVPVTIAVTASPAGAVCSGEPVTFTANASNEGLNPVYAWFVNGSAVGSNSSSFITSTLSNSDAVTCTVTSDLACVSGNPATSAPIVMSVNTSYLVSVDVVASPAGTVCSGVPVTFTASAVNGGTTPVYQWYVNGVADGSNSDTYVSATLANGDVVTCEVTSDLTCASSNPATSVPVVMTVNITLPVSVTIAATPGVSVCEGTDITFAATDVNGGTSPVYAWTVNGSAVGSNSSTFSSSTLINGDEVSCTLTSDEVCTSNNPAVSNDITIVIAPYTVGGVMSSMEAEVCEGESTGTIILSGNVGDILYWQRRIDGGTWANLPGTAGFGTFSEITTAAGVWEYRAVIESGACGVDTSDYIGINVLAAPVASFTYNNLDPTIEFINTSFSATSYSWTFGDGGTSTAFSPIHTYASNNLFNVTLVAYNGACQNTYSTTIDVVAVSIMELGDISLQMYPNPSNGEFDITLSGTNNGSLLMDIYDVTGRLILTEDLSSMNGGSVFHVTLGEVNAGLYNVRFTYNEQSITRVMVVE
ncbi:MAG TPA: hypothetical protein DHV29_02935 [Bacteroidales bacterium]|nr:hypothetical protein [Bacteroidales bacterium]HCB62389.1 hypothetical protein [Bacteroidales bacterium]HCY22424.1 hypothetical protein [Bacteroidales bacterium]